MYEVNYQLTRADLAAYRKLMLKRLTAAAANRSWWQTPLAGVAGILAIGAIVWSLLVWFLPSWTRTPLEALSALIGRKHPVKTAGMSGGCRLSAWGTARRCKVVGGAFYR